MDDLNTIESKDLGPAEKLPSFGERLLAIFVEPKIVFDYIKHRTEIWPPVLVITVLSLVATIITLPVLTQVSDMQLALTGQSVTPAITMAVKITMVIVGLLTPFISVLLIAMLIWLGVLMTTGASDFWKSVSVAAWAYFPIVLAAVINAIILFVTHPQLSGLDRVSVELVPAHSYTSLALLFTTNPILEQIGLAIGLFTIWNLWLLWVGMVRSLRATPNSATIVVVAFLILKLGRAVYAGWQIAHKA